MNSLIIWVLTISPHGAYCMSSAYVEFKTEQECIQAMSTVDKKSFSLSCDPKKATPKIKGRTWNN